jgi:hypothetical protein
MTIVGYRGNLNLKAVADVLNKHANMTKSEAANMAKKIDDGQTLSFETNFLLEEDLKDLNVLVSH